MSWSRELPTNTFVSRRTSLPRRLSPIQFMILGFAATILIGASLLSFPFAQRGTPVGLLDCLFTAVSATCLTGLVTQSTADAWSPFGQGLVLLMVQVGAIGYMTVATLVARLLGVRVGESGGPGNTTQGVISPRDTLRTARTIIIATLALEALGALLLAPRFAAQLHLGWAQAAYHGIFYAISGFCNAGFTLAHGFQGLAQPTLRADTWLLIILGTLIVLGGLGFGVLRELATLPRHRRLSLHARLVLGTTLILIVGGMLLFLFFEARNDQTLGILDNPTQRLVTGWFMSVTARTGGFNPVDLTVVSPPTLMMLSLLMIVGASPLGAGGGIKTTTLSIIVLAIATLLRRRSDIEVFHRRIGGEMVRLALSLVSLYLLAALLVIIGISFTEITLWGLPANAETMTHYARLIFEVLSAFGNVGLSAGITPKLHEVSKVLIILSMLLGRLGPLAFVFAFAQSKRTQLHRLPTEAVMAG